MRFLLYMLQIVVYPAIPVSQVQFYAGMLNYAVFFRGGQLGGS